MRKLNHILPVFSTEMVEDHFDQDGECIPNFENGHHEGTIAQVSIEENGHKVTDQHTEQIAPYHQPESAKDGRNDEKTWHVTKSEHC